MILCRTGSSHPPSCDRCDGCDRTGLASFAQQSARVVTDLLFRHYDDDDEEEDGVGLGKG